MITPVGMALRLFGEDPMQRRRRDPAESYYTPARTARGRTRYFRQL